MTQQSHTPLEVGSTYNVNHSRKGKFSLLVQSDSDEWVTGIIVGGKAGAMLHYNEKECGDEITVRKSFCSFAKAEGGAQ